MPNPQLTELISDTTRAFEHQSSGVLRHQQWHTSLAEHLQAVLAAEGYQTTRHTAETAVEARIAAALAEHRAAGWGECKCGWSFGAERGWGEAHDLHVASVVAALPDIAVVSLPEGENNWQITDWDGGRVSLCYGVDTVRCYLPNPALEVDEAEQLGIALIAASRHLAAARAAGGQA